MLSIFWMANFKTILLIWFKVHYFNKTKKYSIPPRTNLDYEIKVSRVILSLIRKSLITACHDVSDGGLLVSILEMCLATGIGFNFLNLPKNHKTLFSEY